jgi:glycosyltransferase involved in cell wall biosynthesis
MTCRVFIDAPMYREPTHGGVNRFVAEMCAALTKADGFETFVRAPNIRQIQADHVLRRLSFRGRGYLPWLDRLATLIAVRRYHVDLYVNTYYAWQPQLAVPRVCVVYDMIYEKLHERFAGSGQVIARKRQSIMGADRVLCDSEVTRSDLLFFYPSVAQASVEVVPFGVDTVFFSPITDKTSLEAFRAKTNGMPYWLFVGRREFRYKNFATLMHGFRQSRSFSTHKLVVIGGSAEVTASERAVLDRLQLSESVLFLGHVPDALLRAAYAAADALVYPSMYEGFGLPLLEAMACGTLVLSSNAASLPEVGGDVALYFPPTDAQALAEGLDHIAAMTATERDERVQAGLDRASEFSWSRCTNQVIDVLSRVIQERRRPRVV